MPLFDTDDLAGYMGDDYDAARAAAVVPLVLGTVYEVCPKAIADGSVRALAIGLEVAARAVGNPGGYASERIDDYTYQRPAATQRAGVYLTELERSELAGIASATPRRRVRSVRMRSASGPLLPGQTDYYGWSSW